MALHQTRKYDKFNLKLLDSILAGTVQFIRKETHRCHIGMLVLNKNAKTPFVAICFGFREKIASLTGL